MKNRVFNAFLLLAMVGLMFTACKKDYLEPPIDELPIGTVYTIDSILKMRSGTVFDSDASVYGIVTADEQSGNLYKAAFIQDRATGAAIELYLNAVSGVRIGDSIRVYLKDVTYSLYNGMPQLKDFEPDGHIVILANNKPIEPVEVTLADVLSGNYLGQIVKVKNVKFAETELTQFAEVNTYGNRILVDVDQTDYFATVRTSNYANFAKNTLPMGEGSVVCIASLYETSSNTTWQLLIRSISELSFNGYYTVLPYFQAFSYNFGSYTPYNVYGEQVWTIDYQTAKMTGNVNNTNHANEDWLISSPVAISGIDHAKVRVNYAAQYSNSNTEDVTLHVSTNYVAGMDPLEADWTEMEASYPNTANWSDFQTVETSLDEFIGQTVTVAIKFLSSESQSRTLEVKFISVEEGEAAGGGGGGGGHGGEIQSLPYTQSFTTGFGTYTTKDVLGGQSWEIDYQTAKMTGYVNNTNNANEDWLISSPVAITGVDDAKMSMTYIARYFSNLNEDITIWASSDYVFGDEPSSVSWRQVPANLSESNSWSNFITTEISLSEYVGQTVTFAVKYLSTASKAGTIEIQSITIQEGSGEEPPTPPTPGTGEGSGTADDPYNVASGIGLQGQNVTAWVQGYIVGAVRNGLSNVTSNDEVIWSIPVDSYTNVVIADDVTCREIANCVIVNLPSGKPLRTQVNLYDNPGNYGKQLAVLGTLRTYFGQAGLRDSNGTEADFVLEGGDTPPGPGTTEYFNQPLTDQNSFGVFSTYNVAGAQEWGTNPIHPEYGAVMSGYANNTSYANEDWLISPTIDLSSSTNPILVFDHARGPAGSINVGVAEGYYTVWVTNNYTNGEEPNSANWVELTGVNHGTTAWNWVSSGNIVIPASFKTSTCRIAFRYLSIDGASATWEVKNVVVKEQ